MPRNKTTGKVQGFAFLMYEDQRSTVLAVDNLNGAVVLGRTLRVDHVKNYKHLEQGEDGKMKPAEAQSLNALPENFIRAPPSDIGCMLESVVADRDAQRAATRASLTPRARAPSTPTTPWPPTSSPSAVKRNASGRRSTRARPRRNAGHAANGRRPRSEPRRRRRSSRTADPGANAAARRIARAREGTIASGRIEAAGASATTGIDATPETGTATTGGTGGTSRDGRTAMTETDGGATTTTTSAGGET